MEEQAFLCNKVTDLEKEVCLYSFFDVAFKNEFYARFFQVTTLSTLVAKQDEAMKLSNLEKARHVVTSSEHDPAKTVLYIEEYRSLLEKYTEACVVRSSKEGLALKAQEDLKKQVCDFKSNAMFSL